jgi:peptidoglycan glycosyltransferase
VTAAAALDSGKFKPDSTFVDPGYCVEYGQRIFNAGNPDQGLNAYGTVTLFQGLQYSINSVFCNLGKALGGKVILEYAKRFGFYSDPPLETPDDERRPSGLYKGGKLFEPKTNFQVDPGRLAFGQERLQVTPMQMAMVAAAVANRGILMRPYVVDRVLSPSGVVVTRTKPDVYSRPIKPVVAAQLRAMMEAAVTGGTGTAARIPGVRVGGKTGTAETGRQGINTTWFIAFAPVERPRVAIAVVLEDQRGFGGTTAAPLAKVVMQALLGVPSNS